MVYASAVSNKVVSTYYDVYGVERIDWVGFAGSDELIYYDEYSEFSEFIDVDCTDFGEDYRWDF